MRLRVPVKTAATALNRMALDHPTFLEGYFDNCTSTRQPSWATLTPAGSMAASAHGARTATLPWWGGRRAGKGVSPPPPQRRRPPPASRGAHGRGRHSAAQRTCARRAGRPTRRTGGRVTLIAARRGASTPAARWRQQPPTRRRIRRRRAGTITRGSSWARRTPEVAARGRRARLGAVGWGRGADTVRAL